VVFSYIVDFISTFCAKSSKIAIDIRKNPTTTDFLPECMLIEQPLLSRKETPAAFPYCQI
jgi:hypothetical protein